MSMQANAVATQIHGKSDKEILQIARISLGVPELLDLTFDHVCQAVSPDAPDCILGFELDEPRATYTYTFIVQGGQGRAESRPPTDARVVLVTSVANFLRLLVKELDWVEAIGDGRVTARGDLAFLPEIGSVFVPGA